MLIYSIIPARSGSKGLPDKNVKEFCGNPLIYYSINFAKSITLCNKVFCSTDSIEYANIAKECGAEVPFLRSKYASNDTSMEEDILHDLREKFIQHKIAEPDIVIWLRPTFVFRDLAKVNECLDIMLNDRKISAVRSIVQSESRLYANINGSLIPRFDDGEKSMVRRQDLEPQYKVYNTDVLRFKENPLGKAFLGKNIKGVIFPKICGYDIDDEIDFELAQYLYKKFRQDERFNFS